MSDDVWEPLAAAIARGDKDGVVALLEALDEPGRTRLSRHAQRALKALPESIDYVGGETWEQHEAKQAELDGARTAVFGTAGPAAAAQSWWFPHERERLVRARPREWRQDWAERVVARAEVSPWDWALVHELRLDGLIDRPQAVGYVTGAVRGMYADDGVALADSLRADPEWLETVLWRFFTVEEVALTSNDAWHPEGQQSWADTLCELAADGTLDRDRLLDESLAALRRDFSPYNARWYAKFHEALQPTPEERRARLDELLALLAADDPGVVGFALRALEKVKPLPAEPFGEAVPPALLCPVKGHAVRAVKLTGRVMTKPDVLIDALAHDSRDVQELALTLIERHADALDDRERLAGFATEVDPALRARVEALANIKGPGPLRFGPAVAVPGRRPPAVTSWLTERLQPPRDVDELLDRIAVALERGDDPDELELVLDAIGRFRDAELDPGRARALLARAHQLSLPRGGDVSFSQSRDALAFVLVRWLEGGPARLRRTGANPREAIAQRIREHAGDLAPMLSAPTHKGGWIDPRVAVERAGTRELDLAQMVLRLAPEHREEALAAAEPGSVLHYALGGDGERGKGPAWDAAEQARDPSRWRAAPWPAEAYEPSPPWGLSIEEFALLSTPEGLAKAMDRLSGVPSEVAVDPASPVDLLTLDEGWWDEGGIHRWLTRIWPGHQEPLFELAARALWSDADDRGLADVLEVLLDPREPIVEWAALALALALGNAQIELRTLSVDVVIAALGDRRLDGATLGGQLGRAVREQHWMVPARTAASLTDVAAAGPLHAHDVQQAIELALAAAEEKDRRRVLGLVDLLRKLAVEADAAVTNEAARAWLGALSNGSKIGRAGREALAVGGDGAARSRAAASSCA